MYGGRFNLENGTGGGEAGEVRTLSEGNERPWEAWKLKMEGPAFRWESETDAKDLNF